MKLEPGDLDQLLRDGLLLHQSGRREEAEAIYRQVLALDPKFSDAMHYLGLVLYQKKQYGQALELMSRAISINPSKAHYHANAAPVLLAVGQNDAAIEACRRAIALRPRYGEAFYCMGLALKNQRKLEEAAACYHRTVEYKPDHVEAWNALGMHFNDERRYHEGMDCFRRAISINPNFAGPYNNLGHALREMGRLDEAVEAFGRGLQIEPGSPVLLSHLATVLKDMGEIEAAEKLYRQSLATMPDARTGSSLLYTLLFDEKISPQELWEEHKQWNETYAKPLSISIPQHTSDASPDRRIRIGYVSPDFRTHPVGRFLLPLMARHDHTQFEIFCYSDVRKAGGLTDSIKSCADVWRETRGMTDEQVAALVRQDRIDILIDLTMHMGDNRMLLFARNPAPVQVTYLAYPGTTGLETMDYRLSDAFLDPRSADGGLCSDARYYSERTVRLTSYWCYQPARDTPELVPPPALASGKITFGCLNNFCKISDRTLSTWCELLGRFPDSRLIIHANEGSHRQKMRGRISAKGIEACRLEFVPSLPIASYFAQYNRIDIALDPFPYPGGTTTCDALWMGVPVVTLAGQTAISRGGASLLSIIGLKELIAENTEKYLRIASELATDRNRLAQLRSTLRQRMQTSALMDATGFARDVETAFKEMWRNWCAGMSVANIRADQSRNF